MKKFKYVLTGMMMMLAFTGYTQVKVIEDFNEFENQYIKNRSQDSIYVINFWATWCRPCIKELPYFQKIDSTKINNLPVKLTLVSLDIASTVETGLKTFVQKRNIKNEVVALTDENSNEWIGKINSTWTGAIPATLIIYKNKKYFFRKAYHSTDEIKKEIQAIINQ